MVLAHQRDGTVRTSARVHGAVAQVFHRYVVEAELGRGGMGTVYRARDTTTGVPVALKTLDLEQARALTLFEREYHTLSSIDHPAVVTTFDFGVAEDGRRYYTMELVEGDDLYTLAPVPWKALCTYLSQVAAALSLLHMRGLVHRDVSPKNIRIDPSGQVRLLDFGALAPFGVPRDVVGTPACIAPESLRKEPLDARSDLFSLGTTAYIALIKARPYAVLSLSEAESAWRVAPASLLATLPDLPAALDELIQTMLQIDPRKRPDSAADVIERLSLIAGHTELRDSQIPMGHIFTPALVGRERELQQLRRYLDGVLARRGTALVIEGPGRIGKSRFVQELSVESRLRGATAVRVDCSDQVTSGGSYRQLVRAVLEALPSEGHHCLQREPQVRALVDSAVYAPRPAPPPTPAQTSLEAVGETQTAVVRWVEAVAQHRPLVIVADDAHAVDTVSAGVFLGLAHGLSERCILLALTVRTGARLAPAIERTMRISARIKLRELPPAATDALIASIIGEVPHRARLTGWIDELAGGNPGYCVELMAALVHRGVIRWLSGSWSLPERLRTEWLPTSVEDALTDSLTDLDPASLDLARLLAMHGGSAPLSLCCRLLAPADEATALQCCDQLLSESVLRVGMEGYRIAHSGWRDVLLAGVDVAQKQALHRRLGETLMTTVFPEGDQRWVSARRGESDLPLMRIKIGLQAGWHLLHGGDAARGRALLRTMGILLTRHGDGLADAIPALEDALVAYEEQGRSRYERQNLLVPLTLAGTYLDPVLAYRYGHEVVETFLESTGMSLAIKLGCFLPKPVALCAALAWAAVRMRITERRYLARGFREAMLGLVGLTTAMFGNYSTLTDATRAAALLERVTPLGWFPKMHSASLALRFQQSLAAVCQGRYTEAVRISREVVEVLTDPNRKLAMPDDARRQFVVGLYIVIGAIGCYRTDKRVHEAMDVLAKANTRVARETLAGVRANYYANRGEMKKHKAAREKLDVLAAQGGAPWRQDVLMPRCLWWVQAQCEDVLGLKRSVRELEAIARQHTSLARDHVAAHGCYLADRGLATLALERYEHVLTGAMGSITPLGIRIVGAYARVLRLSGQAQRAQALCAHALSQLSDEDRMLRCLIHGTEVELGRSLALTGEPDATRYLDALCDAQADHDNPLLHVLSHHARAEVALMQADRSSFISHIEEAEGWVARSEYAALFGLLQRLRSRADQAGLSSFRRPLQLSVRPEPRQGDAVRDAIAACRGIAERQQVALELILEQSQAACGYLYLAEPEGLRLAAPLHGSEPPDRLLIDLEARVQDWHALEDDDTVADLGEPLRTVVDAEVQDDPIADFEVKLGSAYRVVFLSLNQGDHWRLVGVVALAEGRRPLRAVPQPVIEAIASGVYQAGDATIIRSGDATIIR